MTIARDQGYEVVEHALVRTDLYMADEAFFTGTAAEIVPIASVDDRNVGAGKPGPITRELSEIFSAATRGEVDRYKEWNEHVREYELGPARRPKIARQGRDTRGVLTDVWPLFGLVLRTPRLELRVPSLEQLAALAELADEGVHDPAAMPFLVPWTDLPAGSARPLGHAVPVAAVGAS